MPHRLQPAIQHFLTTGEVPDEFLHAYDQDGCKIPTYLMPAWEPPEWITHNDDGEPFRPLHDRLPEHIDKTRVHPPKKGTKHLRTSFFKKDGIIPHTHIDGNLIHLSTEQVDAPFLEKVNGSAIIPYAITVKIPKLEAVGNDLLIQSATLVDLNQLKTIQGDLDAAMVTNLHMENLTRAKEIMADTSETIHLPELGHAESITATMCQHANLGRIDPDKCVLELSPNCATSYQHEP